LLLEIIASNLALLDSARTYGSIGHTVTAVAPKLSTKTVFNPSPKPKQPYEQSKLHNNLLLESNKNKNQSISLK